FLLGRLASGTVLGLAAYIGFIGLYSLVRAAERACRSRTVHGLADTMAEEPSAFIGHAQHAGHLSGAHTLLGSGHDMRGEQPFVQRDMAALHDGASANGELVAAIVAEEHSG